MWSLYLRSAEGIAVQSACQRLIDSFADYSDFEVAITPVKYIDYKTQAIPADNLLWPYIHKRRSYEHEQELRAMIWTLQHGKNGPGPQNRFADTPALSVPVSLDTLIQRVYVAPTAATWVVELVDSLIRRFDLHVDVVHSDLARAPLY
jgi:hypothetical protein